MTYQPQDSKQSFLPTSIILPDVKEAQQHNLILTDYLKKIIAALNDKDIAQYVLQEILTGQKFFTPDNPGVFRNTFRKVIDFGTLPNTATASVNHEISIDSRTRFTRIYGCANDSNNNFIPLPYINTTTPGDSVELSIDPTDVNITTTTANYAGFTDTFVILEYIKS